MIACLSFITLIIMNSQSYLQFMEKFTRKLADTFQELNQMCVLQMNSLRPPQQPKQIELVQQNKSLPEIAQVEDENKQLEKRERKTKKIKKQYAKDEQEDAILKQVLQSDLVDQKLLSKVPRKKAKKISHKPKAPASSFLLFFKEQQSNISKAFPTYGVTELTKVAAKCWNDLSQQEKDPYIKLCDEERRVYQQKMQVYRTQFPEEIAQKQKDRKTVKKQKKAQQNNSKETPKKQKNEQATGVQILKGNANNGEQQGVQNVERQGSKPTKEEGVYKSDILGLFGDLGSDIESENEYLDDSLGIV